MRLTVNGAMCDLPAVWFEKDRIRFIDQRKLPFSLEFFDAATVEEAAFAIEDMVVRGAPSIGAAGAYGMALAALTGEDLGRAHERLGSTRPTAHDLFYAIDRLRDAILRGQEPVSTAREYARDIIHRCTRIGENGAHLIPEEGTVLTHCNAGALATVDYGTALAPMRTAHRRGTDFSVLVDETRPRMQGRLTAWELSQEGIRHRIIPDNAAGYFMGRGEVDLVITGADRIACNGDAANKIGTYEKAVLARETGVPFYIAAPVSTFDPALPSGDGIEIEFRDEAEVLEHRGLPMFGPGERALNPAFDVTPARYVTGFITERGIFGPDRLDAFLRDDLPG